MLVGFSLKREMRLPYFSYKRRRMLWRIDVILPPRYNHGRPCVGTYSGTLSTAGGKTLEVKNLFGQYEWVDSKW